MKLRDLIVSVMVLGLLQVQAQGETLRRRSDFFGKLIIGAPLSKLPAEASQVERCGADCESDVGKIGVYSFRLPDQIEYVMSVGAIWRKTLYVKTYKGPLPFDLNPDINAQELKSKIESLLHLKMSYDEFDDENLISSDIKFHGYGNRRFYIMFSFDKNGNLEKIIENDQADPPED